MNWLWENRKRRIRHESKRLWPSSRKDGAPWAETGKFTICSSEGHSGAQTPVRALARSGCRERRGGRLGGRTRGSGPRGKCFQEKRAARRGRDDDGCSPQNLGRPGPEHFPGGRQKAAGLRDETGREIGAGECRQHF